MSRTGLGGRPASPTSLGEPRRAEPAPPLSGSETTLDRSAGTTPRGAGLRRSALRKVRKSTVQRYQLLPGSFLQDRMTGPQRLETDGCWCSCGKRQTRHHLFTKCRAWEPQIRALWKKIGEDCKWEHPRASSVRWVWREATEAVIEFLEDTPVGFRSSGMARAKADDRESVGQGLEGEEGGPGPP